MKDKSDFRQKPAEKRQDKPFKEMLRVLGKIYFIAIASIPFAVILSSFSHEVFTFSGSLFSLGRVLVELVEGLVIFIGYGIFFYICCRTCLNWGQWKGHE